MKSLSFVVSAAIWVLLGSLFVVACTHYQPPGAGLTPALNGVTYG